MEEHMHAEEAELLPRLAAAADGSHTPDLLQMARAPV